MKMYIYKSISNMQAVEVVTVLRLLMHLAMLQMHTLAIGVSKWVIKFNDLPLM